jgi:hypothetical protein
MRRYSIYGTIALLLLASVAADAREPTLSDIAACNNEAFARAGGAASPPTEPLRPGVGTPGRSPGPIPAPAPPTSGIHTEGSQRTPGDAVTTDPTGNIVTQAPDPLLKGMAVDGVTDPVYRDAYRDCMERSLRR